MKRHDRLTFLACVLAGASIALGQSHGWVGRWLFPAAIGITILTIINAARAAARHDAAQQRIKNAREFVNLTRGR